MKFSNISRRGVVAGFLATASCPSALFAQDRYAAQRKAELDYARSVRSGDKLAAQRERLILAANLRYAPPGGGIERRERAKALYEEALQPKNAKLSDEGGGLANYYWAEMILEEERSRALSSLPLIRKRLEYARKYIPEGDSTFLRVAICGLHAALLAEDLKDARSWFAGALNSIRGSRQSVARYGKVSVSIRRALEDVSDLYKLGAQLKAAEKDMDGVIRWLEASNRCAQASISVQDPTLLPDTRSAPDDTNILAAYAPVLHLLVSRAGSALICTKQTGDHVHRKMFTVDGLRGKYFDQNDQDILLWGDLYWRVTARFRLSGFHGSYASTNPKTFRDSVPIIGQNLWGCYAYSVKSVLDQMDVQPGSHFYFIQPTGLAVIPIKIANDGESYPFIENEFKPHEGPTSTSLKKISETVENKPPKLVGLFNPGRDLKAADAERAIIANTFPSGTAVELRPGSNASTVLNYLASSGNNYFYFATHGAFGDDKSLGLYLGGRQFLTTKDVQNYTQPLECRLAVMSACETARTGMFASNEPTSLPSALLAKGVSAVIGTHWSVEDRSTAILLSLMMNIHIQEKLDPATALQFAQSWLLRAKRSNIQVVLGKLAEGLEGKNKQAVQDLIASLSRVPADSIPYSNPYYWGGFGYYGY